MYFHGGRIITIIGMKKTNENNRDLYPLEFAPQNRRTIQIQSNKIKQFL